MIIILPTLMQHYLYTYVLYRPEPSVYHGCHGNVPYKYKVLEHRSVCACWFVCVLVCVGQCVYTAPCPIIPFTHLTLPVVLRLRWVLHTLQIIIACLFACSSRVNYLLVQALSLSSIYGAPNFVIFSISSFLPKAKK